MSDLSEAIRAEIQHTETVDEITYQEIGKPGDEETIAPGFTTFQQAMYHRLTKQLRRAYRHHAGEELPPTGEDYLNRTADEMVELLAQPLARAVADGMLVGQENLFMVRKAKASGDWRALFVSESFKKDSEIAALNVLADPDMKEMLKGDLRHTAEALSRGSGYHTTDLSNESYLKKIWDLWALSAISTGVAYYRASFHVGAKWRERDILAGITAATEENGDADASGTE